MANNAKRTTCATINKILKARGIPYCMVRGDCYYWYYPTKENDFFEIPSLYVSCISNCDPEWIVRGIEKDYNDGLKERE